MSYFYLVKACHLWYNKYRSNRKIEESFRILKTDLRACPVFVWNDDHIKGHFMMSCKGFAGHAERILGRLKKRLDKPYQLKASIKRGCNQYLQMEVDTKNWTLDEEKIKQAERFDGYYAIVTNNLNLSTEQVCQTYRGIRFAVCCLCLSGQAKRPRHKAEHECQRGLL